MKLSDTQLVLLSAAAQRDDHAIELPPDLEPAAAERLVARLAGGGLIEELPSTGALPVWRRIDDVAYALRITAEGVKAIGIDETGTASAAAHDPDPQVKGAPSSDKPKVRSRSKASKASGRRTGPNAAKSGQAPPASRRGTKLDHIKDLLARKRGATISEMMDATDWQPHTTRAVLTGLRKRGVCIEREAIRDKPSIYRIMGGDATKRKSPKHAAKAA